MRHGGEGWEGRPSSPRACALGEARGRPAAGGRSPACIQEENAYSVADFSCFCLKSLSNLKTNVTYQWIMAPSFRKALL